MRKPYVQRHPDKNNIIFLRCKCCDAQIPIDIGQLWKYTHRRGNKSYGQGLEPLDGFRYMEDRKISKDSDDRGVYVPQPYHDR